jgi:2-amino-4-hydroxy-6-hydroxymethyldihydropteridine diphosphokinase
VTVYVALGSNLGDRLATLRAAVSELDRRLVRVTARSGLYRTAPVGLETPNDFLNAVVQVSTALRPRALLAELLAAEAVLGRRRGSALADRTCDLDLLLYDDVCMSGGDLELPHPRMAHRRFVLLPLLDLAPDLCDPRSGRTFADLAASLAGDADQVCERISDPGVWRDRAFRGRP